MSWIKGIIWGTVGFAMGSGLMALVGQPLGSEPMVAVGYTFFLIGWLLGAGVWDHWARGWFALENKPTPTQKSHGLARYFAFSTDHKVIGIQYLVTFTALLLLGGALAMVIRIQLLQPAGLLDPQTYNTVMSMHGIIMIAVAVAAILGSFGNYFVPLLIGAEDMAFPRLNALSYWLVPPVAIALVVGSLLPGGFTSGWRVYPPLAERGGISMLLYLLAFFTFGLSSIIGGLNFIVTIIRMRAPGMTWGRLPIFVWSIFCASILSLLFTQFVATALLMELMDRVLGMAFFAPDQGGGSILYQHLFWFYSHPAVYVMIIPGFGILMEVVAHFSRKPLFGYKYAVGALLGIVGLSGIVWAHHMFTSGMQDYLTAPFMLTTELISIPTGMIFLVTLGTIWQGRMRLTTPMLFALGFLFNFTIGGLTGIFNADAPTDLHLHNTYWIVGHFHYTIMGGEIFAFLAAIYYWFPKITGRMYNDALGKLHFGIMFVAFNLLYTPMMIAGFYGMNRHIATYPPELTAINQFMSIAGFVLGASFLVFIYNMALSLRRGTVAAANPWQLRTLEWQTASPPPEHNFSFVVRVDGHPYDYGVDGSTHVVAAPTHTHKAVPALATE
ncbi:MAG: cbb3-type cytochrome c oxidase subunit I [Chloroflexi bacterium]|nr:cbb3-type cytochrome c oxidase subunit I [Chloroflexota bacterium]